MKYFLALAISGLIIAQSQSSCFGQTETEVKKQNDASKKLLKKSSFEDNPTFVSSLMAMLRNPFVIEDLDLVDYQKEDLKNIQYEWQKELNTIVRGSSAARGRERTEKIMALYQDLTKRIETVLLKKQIARLRQITLQYIARKKINVGLLNASVLENPLISREIDMSPKQRKKIREMAREINKKLEEKIKKLKKQANEELISELDKDQIKLFRSLIGEPFEFRRSSRSSRNRK